MDSQDTLTNTVTATLTWQGFGPAPAVIVEEDAAASWFIDGDGTGTCSCGLPNPTHIVYNQDASDYATRYTFYPAPASGTATITLPAETTSGSTTLDGDYETDNFVNLSYSVTPYPVTIKLAGTTPDSSGNLNILIGQHCSSSLVGVPSSCTVSNYNWTVSGTTFQTWSADTPANGNDPYNSDASYEVDGPGALTNPTAGWYWNDHAQTPETVSCTATVTPPAGQGSAFTVTATQKVTVMVPGFTFKAIGGTMQVNTAKNGGNGTDYYLYAGPTAGTSQGAGMEWDATVSPPPGTTFGAGSLELIQLVIPNRSYTTAGLFGSTSTHSWSMNGQEGLDTSYPYGWDAGAPAYETNDTPSFDLTAVNAQSAQMGDQFEDYLMYFAPGSSQCVPLARFVWSTNGNVTIPGTGNWANFGAGSAGTVTPSGVTIIGPSNAFPMWTQIITATSGSF